MRILRIKRALLFAVVILASGAAQARHHGHSHSGDGTPGQFDYYLLSLSWSPAYCIVHPQDGTQCQGRGFGFVLHGLWPQFDGGGYPQFCGDPALPQDAFALGARIYPSPKLVRHECSGLGPQGYFQAADRALASVRVPPQLEAPRADQTLSADQIQAAFRSANPGLPDNALQVACSRGELSEVRVCLTRDLKVRPCGRGVRSSCPSYPVKVRSVR